MKNTTPKIGGLGGGYNPTSRKKARTRQPEINKVHPSVKIDLTAVAARLFGYGLGAALAKAKTDTIVAKILAIVKPLMSPITIFEVPFFFFGALWLYIFCIRRKGGLYRAFAYRLYRAPL